MAEPAMPLWPAMKIRSVGEISMGKDSVFCPLVER